MGAQPRGPNSKSPHSLADRTVLALEIKDSYFGPRFWNPKIWKHTVRIHGNHGGISVANALSALYVKESEEERLLDAMLLALRGELIRRSKLCLTESLLIPKSWVAARAYADAHIAICDRWPNRSTRRASMRFLKATPIWKEMTFNRRFEYAAWLTEEEIHIIRIQVQKRK